VTILYIYTSLFGALVLSQGSPGSTNGDSKCRFLVRSTLRDFDSVSCIVCTSVKVKVLSLYTPLLRPSGSLLSNGSINGDSVGRFWLFVQACNTGVKKFFYDSSF
jgi:hypothetical protein